MSTYIIRRLLLMLPTVLGITVACFILIQLVPGGPVEEFISRYQALQSERGSLSKHSLSSAEVDNIKAYFGFDQPAHIRYIKWLKNLLRLDMGTSYAYQEPVWGVISSKFPISLFFGLTSLILAYLVSIPLGMLKAVKDKSHFDTVSSVIVFTGYVMPGYALGVILIVFLGGGSYLNWFPISGIVSDNWEHLPLNWKVLDFLHHMVLPITCYMIGDFAFLTMLMKNTLLEEINKDYIRTALVKGLSFNTAVWKHAFRNALIPIVTDLGGIFSVMFAGSVLIERVFDINGMGLLFYDSIIARDYNVVMGIILLTSMMVVIGRLFSDILYVLTDPRIRFD